MSEQKDSQKITPKLRFPEFQTASWKEQALSEIGNAYNGLSGKTKNDFGKGKLYIQYKQVFANPKIDISDCGLVNIMHQESQNKVQYGDVLFTTSSETPEEVGMSSVCLNNVDELYLNSFCFGFRPKSEKILNSNFSQFLFRNYTFRYQVIRLAQGSTRFNISKSKFVDLRIALPDWEEQQKIADCLSSLDELIELQEQKLAALKQHKKGLMQQLFPSQNDLQASRIVYPKLRFPQFKDCKGWEVVELNIVSDFVKEKIEVSKLNVENYISTENILADYSGVASSSKLPTNHKVTAYKIGDILVSNIRPYLKKVWHSNKNGGVSNDIIVIRAKQNINAYFLSSIIKNDDFIDYMMKGAKGVKMPRGDLNLISVFPFAIPSSPEEQQAIADCLSSLDSLISEQNQQICRLKTHKKGLMQQLFPTLQ